MADNNNIIKPVEGLQNIAQLGPVARRQQRKRRENHTGGHNQSGEQPQAQAQSTPETDAVTNSKQNNQTIDYKA